MKKYIFLIVGLVLMVKNVDAQESDKNSFAGKTFRIDNYIGDKLDNSEDLVFTNTEVEGSICVQYGFKKAEYIVKTIRKGVQSFSCTMISKEHGKMVDHKRKIPLD